MKNTTEVPNDLIISAHKEACDKWKGIIEKACPLLFPKDFKEGDWLIVDNCEIPTPMRVTSISGGYYRNEIWENNKNKNGLGLQGFAMNKKSLRLATDKEVESHLIKVAEEKGYLKGVKIKSDYSNKEGVITGAFFMNDGDLCVNVEGNKSILVFDNETGKWATIIPSPLELTLEEVAKKFGVSEVKIKQ